MKIDAYSSIDTDKLAYLGVEGLWKLYYEEGSLHKFVYVSAKKSLVFNCIYEAQFYKSKLGNDIFGSEIVFEDENGRPVAFAVQVTRPGVYLDDLVYKVWSDRETA